MEIFRSSGLIESRRNRNGLAQSEQSILDCFNQRVVFGSIHTTILQSPTSSDFPHIQGLFVPRVEKPIVVDTDVYSAPAAESHCIPTPTDEQPTDFPLPSRKQKRRDRKRRVTMFKSYIIPAYTSRRVVITCVQIPPIQT